MLDKKEEHTAKVIEMETLINNSNLASALSAVAGVCIAALAFVISAISLYVSIKALRHQQKHNILSVKPIPEVTVASYENSLRIKLRNNGTGPLMIKRFFVKKNGEERPSIIKWMEGLPNGRLWTHFASDINGRSILPGKIIPLLELTEYENEKDFNQSRDACRKWLRELECFVCYSDVYGSRFEIYTKKLTWFGKRT
jgi:hypothetical protein